jgi:hypothetical protein
VLVLSQVTQAKATADLVPAAQEGDLATVQECLSKKANIDVKAVRSRFTCDVMSDESLVCMISFVEGGLS